MKNLNMVSGSFALTLLAALPCLAQNTPRSPYPVNTTRTLTTAQVNINVQPVTDGGVVKSLTIQPDFTMTLGEPGKTQVNLSLTANNTDLQLVSEIDPPQLVNTGTCFGNGIFQTYKIYLVTGQNRQLVSQTTELAENTLGYDWDAAKQQWVPDPRPTTGFLDRVAAFRESLNDANRNLPANVACEQLDHRLTDPPNPGSGTIHVSLPITFGKISCSGLKAGIESGGDGNLDQILFGIPYHYNDLIQSYQGTLTINNETKIAVNGSGGNDGYFRGTSVQNSTCPGN